MKKHARVLGAACLASILMVGCGRKEAAEPTILTQQTDPAERNEPAPAAAPALGTDVGTSLPPPEASQPPLNLTLPDDLLQNADSEPIGTPTQRLPDFFKQEKPSSATSVSGRLITEDNAEGSVPEVTGAEISVERKLD